ncbi:MAG: MBL fold metallo-hydrolase [Lachnospiraceae bacterium]|nr:MBL fold metallo-hydrolase [Lachnospiraceae bacterium]
MKKRYLICMAVLLICLLAAVVLYKKWDRLFPEDKWEITQYGPRDINSSFYTIYNPSRGLILIDGGWKEDAQYVRDIINLHGGKVDVWIISHAHQDHVGAFNEIYPDPQGIKIGKVYTVDMASPQECLDVAPWDSVDAYREFLDLKVKNLEYVSAGDELELFDLKFTIYNAYDDSVAVLSRDYLNDGSMMFEVEGKETSFLFCSDVGVAMSEYLLGKWGEDLAADYLQMGHHGYGGLEDDFYQKVNPRISFFDAPDWLVRDTTGRYDTPEHVRLMEGMGSEVRSFCSAPNGIVLE